MSANLKERFSQPYDQGQVGWCFGYAAADLLSQASGESVSAIHTSAKYAASLSGAGRLVRKIFGMSKTVSQGGFIDDAFDDIQDLGYVCPDTAVTSSGYVSGATGMSELASFLKEQRNGNCTGYCASSLNALVHSYLKGQDTQAVIDYVDANKSENFDKMVFNLFERSCQASRVNLRQSFKMQVFNKSQTTGNRDSFETPLSMTERIDQGLSQGKLVGLEYLAMYIADYGPLAGHASSIMGRKEINGVCHYLVRNSWGESCSYKSGVICERKQGAYWVPRETMNNMALRVMWVK